MPTLATYLQRIQRILGDTTFERFNPYDLIAYVNEARGHIAGEGECVRQLGSISTTGNTEQYSNTNVTLPTGAASVITIYSISYSGTTPPTLLEGRSWEWFQFYWRTMGVSAPSIPQAWAPYQPGAVGSFFIGPVPDAAYSLSLDLSCQPSDLTNNSSIDLLPYPWSDAVPFYASQLALRSDLLMSRTNQSQLDSVYKEYERLMVEARSNVTPSIQPMNYPGGAKSRRAPGASPLANPPALSPAANSNGA